MPTSNLVFKPCIPPEQNCESAADELLVVVKAYWKGQQIYSITRDPDVADKAYRVYGCKVFWPHEAFITIGDLRSESDARSQIESMVKEYEGFLRAQWFRPKEAA